MVLPVPAVVIPRVVIGGVSVRLEDEIRERLENGTVGLIHLVGPPGCGKSAALEHLAFLFGDDSRLLLADNASVSETTGLDFAARFKLIIFAAASAARVPEGFERWAITLWTQDTWIEYALASHRDRCSSVMRRVLADPDASRLEGRPELWRPVLDALAVDDSLPDLRSAVRSVVAARLTTPQALAAARLYCFSTSCNKTAKPVEWSSTSYWIIGSDAVSLLRHSFAQTIFAAEHLATAIESGQGRALLAEQLPKSLIQETAALLVGNDKAVATLQEIITGLELPMAASLLLAIKPDWTPNQWVAPRLAGAYLERAQWRGIHLKRLAADKAELAECDLSDAQIDRFDGYDADLSGATLHGAKINNFYVVRAKFVAADLSNLRVTKSQFCSVDLTSANLAGATLSGADFRAADLSQACFRRADLSKAILKGAQLPGTDFSGADLSGADLTGLSLREADFSGANLTRAILCNCNLEEMTLPGARLESADLGGAYLTASRMPNANLRWANLTGAGLAEIDWEQADLRGADFRQSTFHLGSSRSGLVGSPLACEGSRTGFYTDELNEQDFKSPEEIRKANLRGSDLRGANIEGVDFYLVDVRDCLYTADQERLLRQTGAILETRV